MNPVKIVIGFVPFILFSVLENWLSVGWAAAIGLIAALGVAAITAPGGLKILPVVQAVILAVTSAVGFASSGATNTFLDTYGRGLASLALGGFIVVTATWMPFTAQFARAVVPRDQWHSPTFIRVNRTLSMAWGGVVLVLGACHLLGAYLDAEHIHTVLRLALEWGIPVMAFIWVISFTRRIVRQNPATFFLGVHTHQLGVTAPQTFLKETT